MQMDDRDIIALYFARDERALAETERKYGGYCFSMAYSILKNHEDAQEVVSDTWLRVWNSIPPQIPKVLKLYIAKIVRNLALNTYRNHTALKRGGGEMELVLEELNGCIPAPGNVGDRLACQELAGKIQAFLKTQSRRDRGIFVSRYFHVEECATIAQHFGLTEGNVHRILSRMRKKLKDHLNREGYRI
jgi:RNA polymerase sigma-70 factor (ECF subfamily)